MRERLLLFVSPQNTIANSGGEFEHETLTKCKVSLLNKIILFDQMQPYRLYISFKNDYLTFQLTLLSAF